ncbi:MAG: TIR domain-containing protein [Lachnospiraceae bacterium]|nr:TIR domain-containing protein [Ruminococcus sp.]MCM1276159.1 TIR domain-containing protein [Lachnospiraceae bacterium]
MAIFKCKMCNGNLNVIEGSTVCECDYCGTQQTVPSDSGEKKVNLFNRANRLRTDCEFDKAAAVYENIVAEFPEEAEAYWGLCLCKFGIEYVDDPATGKKVPTCRRTAFDSIFDDKDFERACANADSAALAVYRAEAKEIDRLQKGILEIARNEEPFDVFISYKETAADGQRTKDSVLAQDIYDELTAKGYKVFFSRITLEDILGRDYEPYIFAALNSAKIMLVVGTSFDNFNAVWVKNEWSRFLALMQNDRSRTLIPCYCDVDPYDMPPEFKHLQGQDMSKVGFLQDLTRGVGKIIPKGGAQPAVVQVAGKQSIEPLLERVFMFLGSNEWDNADQYCEKVLDLDPKCGRAYLGKLLSEFNCRREEELGNLSIDITSSPNYKNAVHFGVDLEEQSTKAVYNAACKLLAEGDNYESLTRAKEYFQRVARYGDSAEKLEQCAEKLAEADELTESFRDILRSYDAETERTNAMALNKVLDARENIQRTYPAFGGGEVNEPWKPTLLNVWLIPLGIGLIACGICLLISEHSSQTFLSVIGILSLVVSMIIAGVANGIARDCLSGGYLGGMVALGVGYMVAIGFALSFAENRLGSDTASVLTALLGVLLIAAAALTIALYCSKTAKIRHYLRDNKRLDKLIDEMKEARKRDISEAFANKEMPNALINDCLQTAQSSYK